MDPSTEKTVTEALDLAIASVAEEWFGKLSKGLSDQEVAKRVCKSLCSFRDLQKGNLPQYGDWDALLYSIWYQPSQINLAYSLARKTFNKLMTGQGDSNNHEVLDFGCGAFAMQFGLALAAADVVEEYNVVPRIGVIPCDSSEDMIEFGHDLWSEFKSEVGEFKNYKELYRLRQVVGRITLGVLNTSAKRWLSALHVAYRDNHSKVKQHLKTKVKSFMPDIVLTTCHPMDQTFVFSPLELGYRDISIAYNNQGLAIPDNFQFKRIKTFREKVYEKIIGYQVDRPDCPFHYLNKSPSWTTQYQSNILVYVKH